MERAPGAGVLDLFNAHVSDTFVEDEGVVVKVLPDDIDRMDGGGFHQKVLVEVAGGHGHTILIAHNIDSGKRVPMTEGDRIAFRGEYEWTAKGGTVHFTHAPKFQSQRPGGWILHNGVRYQ